MRPTRAPWSRRVAGHASALRVAAAKHVDFRFAAKYIRRDPQLSQVRDTQDLVDAVANKRGQPVTVLYLPLPPSLSGFCIRAGHKVIVVVDRQASPLHRDYILCHELWHVLWDVAVGTGEGHGRIDEDLIRSLLPDLDFRMVQQVLPRSDCGEAHEKRAEAFALVMLQRLPLRPDLAGEGLLTSVMSHRRTGV